MATTGKFEFTSDAWGTTAANQVDLKEEGALYKVRAMRVVGKNREAFYLDFPKREGSHTFAFSELSLVKYEFFNDDYVYRFTGKSGSLKTTSVAGAVAVNGAFSFEMSADADSDPAGPKTLAITKGVLDLKN